MIFPRPLWTRFLTARLPFSLPFLLVGESDIKHTALVRSRILANEQRRLICIPSANQVLNCSYCQLERSDNCCRAMALTVRPYQSLTPSSSPSLLAYTHRSPRSHASPTLGRTLPWVQLMRDVLCSSTCKPRTIRADCLQKRSGRRFFKHSACKSHCIRDPFLMA